MFRRTSRARAARRCAGGQRHPAERRFTRCCNSPSRTSSRSRRKCRRPLNMSPSSPPTWARATTRGPCRATSAMCRPSRQTSAIMAARPQGGVIDVREPGNYAAGHLPGAVSIPQADLASRMDEYRRTATCSSSARRHAFARCVAFLRSMGFDRATNMAGSTDAWIDAGYPSSARHQRVTRHAVPSLQPPSSNLNLHSTSNRVPSAS